jgi:GcrA cell cycle regulator
MGLGIWTDDRVERLKALWKNGATGSEIANELGVSRNAVLGKVFRLGMSVPKIVVSIKRSRTVQKSWDKRYRPNPPEFTPIKYEEPIIIDADPRGIVLLDLGPNDCRYPDGEGSTVTFCGHPQIGGSSYCGAHHALSLNRPRVNSDVVTAARARRIRGINFRRALLEGMA